MGGGIRSSRKRKLDASEDAGYAVEAPAKRDDQAKDCETQERHDQQPEPAGVFVCHCVGGESGQPSQHQDRQQLQGGPLPGGHLVWPREAHLCNEAAGRAIVVVCHSI